MIDFDDRPKLRFKEKIHFPLLNLSRGLRRRVAMGGVERARLEASHPALPVIVLSMLDVGRETWDAITFLCADNVEEKGGRLEFAVAVPPLARTFADSLFSIVFLFEDRVSRSSVFMKANAAKLHLDDERYTARYGSKPEWQDYLNHQRAQIDWWKTEAGFTKSDVADAKKISRSWPNPGGMKALLKDATLRDFLAFADDWYYARLSQDAHLQGPGWLRQGSAASEEQNRNAKKHYRNDVVMTAFTLYLAALSELAVLVAQTGDPIDDAIRLWNTLTPYWGFAGEVWDERYRDLLTPLAAP